MSEVFNISLESLNFFAIMPMLIAVAGAIIILVVDLCIKDSNKQLYTILTLLFLILDLGYIVFLNFDFSLAFFDLILIDGLSLLGQVILLTAAILFIPLTLNHNKFHEFEYPEYYALFLFLCAGFQFMMSSDHLIVILLGLEVASLVLYTLIAMHNRKTAFEAAIKYFTMGALSAGCFAYGAMLLYAATGYLDLSSIVAVLQENDYEPFYLVLAGVSFFIVALGFKCSLVPFHTWTPDVYEGSNAFLAGFMSIAPKIAALIVSIRIFSSFVDYVFWVHSVFYILIIVTITLPNLIALTQKDVKRMLAYSSISHAGFAFSAILIGDDMAYSALFLYWILFLFTNLGIFGMLWISRSKGQIWDTQYDHTYEKFSGLIKLSPLAAVIMGLLMLALAGIPPFSLFWGKIYLIGAAISNDYLLLAIVMAINSAIAAYYYLKLIVYMFLKQPIIQDGSIYLQNATLPLKIIVGIAVFCVCVSMFFVDKILFVVSGLLVI
ncbi:NADH-quinone oxidoreductase subunit NuoN [Helicobacter mesocricetorum]|uniref:NADH-quinone oxidoreductase subunit NuoN n=1 Tax=Helicobacter mesocricetorum TaxID=87012 RepID=UPI000CF1593E|nr:NADH-quinone oxidoreductase subunit NuoN [Helicobacter mesocricetorum]